MYDIRLYKVISSRDRVNLLYPENRVSWAVIHKGNKTIFWSLDSAKDYIWNKLPLSLRKKINKNHNY